MNIDNFKPFQDKIMIKNNLIIGKNEKNSQIKIMNGFCHENTFSI